MATIQDQINNTPIGGSVVIPPGTYTGQNVTINRAINVTMSGVFLDKARLRVTGEGAKVTGVTVRKWDAGEPITHTSGGQCFTAGITVEADNVTLTDCEATLCAGTGIGVFGQDQPRIWRTGVTLTMCAGTECGRNGIAWAFTKNLTLRSCKNIGNNTKKLAMAWESGSKGYVTDGTLIEGWTAYDNFGPGEWMDYQDTNYTIRKSEFHHNTNWIGGDTWAAPGLALEISEGPGAVEDCWFHDADLESGHVAIWEAMNVTFRRCKFDGPGGIQLRDLANRPPYRLKNIRFENCEWFNCPIPNHAQVAHFGTIKATKAGPPASWASVIPTPPPVPAPTPAPVWSGTDASGAVWSLPVVGGPLKLDGNVVESTKTPGVAGAFIYTGTAKAAQNPSDVAMYKACVHWTVSGEWWSRIGTGIWIELAGDPRATTPTPPPVDLAARVKELEGQVKQQQDRIDILAERLDRICQITKEQP